VSQLFEYWRSGDMRFLATVEQSQPRLGACRRRLSFWRQQLRFLRQVVFARRA